MENIYTFVVHFETDLSKDIVASRKNNFDKAMNLVSIAEKEYCSKKILMNVKSADEELKYFANEIQNTFDGAKVIDSDYFESKDSYPKRLFIYKKWNDFTKEIIEKNQLYLNNPKKFNDPFDCQMQIIVSGNLDESIKKIGVCSLSGSKNNILMWSHYADGHCGVCLEFDSSELLKKDMAEIIKVRYVNKIPSYLKKFRISESEKLFLSYKHKDWSYENEYRIIHGNSQEKNFKISPNALKKVYIGCNMKSEIISEVSEFIKNINSNYNRKIELFKTEKSVENFELTDCRIEI